MKLERNTHFNIIICWHERFIVRP